MVRAAEPGEGLVELVRASTGGRSWDENASVSLELLNGLLIVKQSKSVQREVRRLIGEIRSMK